MKNAKQWAKEFNIDMTAPGSNQEIWQESFERFARAIQIDAFRSAASIIRNFAQYKGESQYPERLEQEADEIEKKIK